MRISLIALGAIAMVAGALAVALSDGERSAARADGAAPSTAVSASTTVAASRPVSRNRATRIAVRHIERRFGQPARADGSERADDHGARWQIDVVRRDRAEFDVYVGSAGRVVHVKREGRASAPESTSGSVSRRDAERIADRHVEKRFGQPARVTDSEPTRGEGARWWVELRRQDGAIVEVYVTANGRIAQVEAEFDDD